MDTENLAEGFMDEGIAADPHRSTVRPGKRAPWWPGPFGPQVVAGAAVEYALTHPGGILVGDGSGRPRPVGAADPPAGGSARPSQVPPAP